MNSVEPHPTKLLFICSQNRWRSLTTERIFSGVPSIQVRSAGTQLGARVVVTEGHVGWAVRGVYREHNGIARLRRLLDVHAA